MQQMCVHSLCKGTTMLLLGRLGLCFILKTNSVFKFNKKQISDLNYADRKLFDKI